MSENTQDQKDGSSTTTSPNGPQQLSQSTEVTLKKKPVESSTKSSSPAIVKPHQISNGEKVKDKPLHPRQRVRLHWNIAEQKMVVRHYTSGTYHKLSYKMYLDHVTFDSDIPRFMEGVERLEEHYPEKNLRPTFVFAFIVGNIIPPFRPKKDEDYKEVRMQPKRSGYFVEHESGRPVIYASRIYMVGKTIWAKGLIYLR